MWCGPRAAALDRRKGAGHRPACLLEYGALQYADDRTASSISWDRSTGPAREWHVARGVEVAVGPCGRDLHGHLHSPEAHLSPAGDCTRNSATSIYLEKNVIMHYYMIPFRW